MVSDFANFRLYNLDTNEQFEFGINELYQHVKLFGFIEGYQTQIIKPQDPINIKAAERMGKLHDTLKAVGYAGKDLEIYLVRLLFCLFAKDTRIFDKRLFQDYIETKTNPAIFGSLFQSIMDADARRNLGAHYTSEENILKLIKPLFLYALWAESKK